MRNFTVRYNSGKLSLAGSDLTYFYMMDWATWDRPPLNRGRKSARVFAKELGRGAKYERKFEIIMTK